MLNFKIEFNFKHNVARSDRIKLRTKNSEHLILMDYYWYRPFLYSRNFCNIMLIPSAIDNITIEPECYNGLVLMHLKLLGGTKMWRIMRNRNGLESAALILSECWFFRTCLTLITEISLLRNKYFINSPCNFGRKIMFQVYFSMSKRNLSSS